MAIVWTEEKLLALSPEQLENVRKNSLAKPEHQSLAALCARIQASRRKPGPNRSALDPVIGFHFVCKGSDEVIEQPDGTFWSGVWAVSPSHCDPAMRLGGYVALHETKAERSYRQGKILDWKEVPRVKGTKELGVTFLLSPVSEDFPWFGEGSGERGYRYASDEPKWDGVSN